MSLPSSISSRLRLPLISAPMLRVSGPDLVIESCKNGVIGAFPTANAGSDEELDAWLDRIVCELKDSPVPTAPWCPNLIMSRNPDSLRRAVDSIVRHGVEMVITSVGSPAPVVKPLHDAGCLIFADVATVQHARKAIDAGTDGLILLTAGAGGQTGWLNAFAFVRAVRAFFDGPLVLAGGISDGQSMLAARVLGCDLVYMGTRFIATHESMAAPGHKQMLVVAEADDVVLTRAFTGLPTSMLKPSIVAAGMDPDTLDENITAQRARELFGNLKNETRPARWKDIWSAGHSVSGIQRVVSVKELVNMTESEYRAALASTSAHLGAMP